MKTLPTQAELQELLCYDPRTGDLFWQHRGRHWFSSDRIYRAWNTRYANKKAFTAIDKKGYLVGAIHDVPYRASRVIFKHVHGLDADQVDHEDGDRKNNRIDNLRDATGQQNQQNMKTPRNNTSGHIGVSWDAAKGKWAARIQVAGKTINLGRFIDFQDAVASRKQAEKDYGFHQNHGR